MKTRLFVRPVSDIQVYDTMWMGGNLGLVTDWATFGIINSGDIISLDMTNKFVNPGYSGQRTVLWMEPFEDKCVIILNYTFGSSTNNETGSIRNIVRGQAQFSDILVEGGGTTESFGTYTYQGLDTNGNPWYFYPGTFFSIKWYEPEDESFKGWVLYDNLDNPVYAAPSMDTAMASPCSSVSWVVQEPYGEAPVPSFTCTSKYSVRFQAVELDLKQDSQFPLSYQIADIREPQNRKSDYSKQITLPGTKNNADILEQLFEIGVDSAWNVNLKKDCFVLQEGQEVLAGSIRIDSIQRDQWNNVEYKVSILGRLGDFFQALTAPDGTEYKLSDLDLREWYSDMTGSNYIVESWSGFITHNGAPFNSFTFEPSIIFTGLFEHASGRIGITLSSGHNLAVGDVIRVTPAGASSVYLTGDHTVVQAGPTSVIINYPAYIGINTSTTGSLSRYTVSGEGYVYPSYFDGATGYNSSVFIQPTVPAMYVKTLLDTLFKKVGWTYESDFFDSQYFKRLIWLSYSKDFRAGLDVNFSTMMQILNNSSNIAQFPNITSNWIGSWNPNTNTYTNNTASISTMKFTTSSIGAFAPNAVTVGDLNIKVYTSLDPAGVPDPNWLTGTGYLDHSSPVFFSGSTPMNGSQWTTVGGASVVQLPEWEFELTLYPGESFRMRYDLSFVPLVNANWRMMSGQLKSLTKGIPVGDSTLNSFMIDLIKMFNLMVEADKYDQNHLKIEPFSSYYLPDIIDWTYNVDISQSIDIVPISPMLPKTYKFSYSEDSDYMNKLYKDSYQEVYGSYEKSTETNWNKNIEILQLKEIAPTPYIMYGNTPVAVISNYDNSTGYTPVPTAKTRLFYWGGTRRSSAEVNVNGVNSHIIGQAGHLDQPLDSTVDLNFGQASAYGITLPFRLTSNNLYNKFYSQYIEELSDNSSLKVTFSMKLNANDIRDLRFDAIYLIKDTYYRLQKVIDWDPMTGAPCKVEMLKIRQYPAHQ